jgi:uncharacterized membrane protein (UPF0127 family)
MTYRVLLFVCLSAFVWSCKETTSVSGASQTVAFTKEGTAQLYKQQTDSLIAQFDIEFARTDYEVETGLMHRNSMEDSQGMLFIFEKASPRFFYMKNTRIPLDIIYLSEDKTIVSFHKNAQPFDETILPSEFPAKYVLEINGGLIERIGINLGDQLDFQRLP